MTRSKLLLPRTKHPSGLPSPLPIERHMSRLRIQSALRTAPGMSIRRLRCNVGRGFFFSYISGRGSFPFFNSRTGFEKRSTIFLALPAGRLKTGLSCARMVKSGWVPRFFRPCSLWTCAFSFPFLELEFGDILPAITNTISFLPLACFAATKYPVPRFTCIYTLIVDGSCSYNVVR